METVSVPRKAEKLENTEENRPKLAAVEMPPQEEDTSEKLQSILRDIFDETGSSEENHPKKTQDSEMNRLKSRSRSCSVKTMN